MGEEKIDLVLKEIQSLRGDVHSLKEGQIKLEEGQIKLEAGQIKLETGQMKLEAAERRNYDLIQQNGVRLEQVVSDVAAIAEGHGILLNKIEEVKTSVAEVDDKLEETRKVVGETNRMLKAHIRLPAHV